MSACTLIGDRSSTEEARFETLATLSGGVEIRRYAPRLAAEVTLGPSGSAPPGGLAAMMDRNQAFRLLFRYITGANEGTRKIAMTVPVQSTSPDATETDPDTQRGAAPAPPLSRPGGPERIAMTVPVAMGADDSGTDAVMRFFLPASLTAETAPRPTDPRVRVVELPAQDWAVIRFAGLRSERETARQERALLARLAGSAHAPVGEPVVLAYDPPWTLPPFRRNEVAVRVESRPASNP